MARILLVEDETRLAAAIKRGLEGEGFTVDIAADGVDGEWLATEHPFDAIVLDIMLPGQDGFAVCEHLRRANIWTPVLMLTARDAAGDEVRSLNTGADDYLTKPFSFQVLVARIRALLRRGAPERAPLLASADLILDPGSRTCRRAATAIGLTAREFAVLEFFLRRPGVVVSKAEILANVWDFAFDGDPNIVEVYVLRLRKKIDEPFGTTTIETVRGSGYRLRAATTGDL